MLNGYFNILIKSLNAPDLEKPDAMHNIYMEYLYTKLVWDYSDDIMKYGTDDNKKEMMVWAEKCDTIWNSQTNTWEDKNDDDAEVIEDSDIAVPST